MNFRRQATQFLGLCFSVLSGVAVAGFDEGVAAYGKGDYATALREWRPLAAQGHASAQFGLGAMYDEGQGVAQDYREAVKWYRLAAAQGHADAQSNLGLRYTKGLGVTQDYREALRWFRLAAAQGHAQAQNNLGAMHAQGQGVAASRVAAYALFNLSEANDPSSANKGRENRTHLAETLSPQEMEAGQALTRELGRPGNLLKALDRYIKTKGAGQ